MIDNSDGFWTTMKRAYEIVFVAIGVIAVIVGGVTLIISIF